MEGPTKEAEAFIPMENVISSSRNMLNGSTTTLRRKAGFRIESRYPAYSSLPQDEDIPATKKPRLDPIIKSTAAVTNVTNDVIDLCFDSEDEEDKLNQGSPSIDAIVDAIDSLLGMKRTPIVTATAEAGTKTASPDVAMDLPPPLTPSPPANVVVDDDDVTNNDSVMDTQLIQRATGVTRRWTLQDDEALTSAVANTCKMKWGENKYRTDWVAIASLVQGRTKSQCIKRWHNFVKPSVAQATGRADMWTTDEDSKLKNAIQTHGSKDWFAIAALVPGRTKKQCRSRWNDFSNHSIHQVPVRSGTWTEDEDKKLTDAVHMHGGKDWGVIATLVPGRTRAQCTSRWHGTLNPSIALTAGRAGPWTEDEDSKLRDSIELHGDKDWIVIAALVPGRTKAQCRNRWHNAVNPSIALTAGRAGPWREDEDLKLRHAVEMYGSKDWDAIKALVPGRAKRQCSSRWHDVLKHRIDLVTGRSGMWVTEEDSKLKDAVQTHGSKDWVAIAALVPGRTKKQCWDRWKKIIVPNHCTILKEEHDIS